MSTLSGRSVMAPIVAHDRVRRYCADEGLPRPRDVRPGAAAQPTQRAPPGDPGRAGRRGDGHPARRLPVAGPARPRDHRHRPGQLPGPDGRRRWRGLEPARPPDRRRPGHDPGDRLDPRHLGRRRVSSSSSSPTSLVAWRLRRIGGDGIALALGARPPRTGDPEETQLADVVDRARDRRRHRAAAPPALRRRAGQRVRLRTRSRSRHGRSSVAACSTSSTARRPRASSRALIGSAVGGDLGLAVDIAAVYVTYGLMITTLSAVVSPTARAQAGARRSGRSWAAATDPARGRDGRRRAARAAGRRRHARHDRERLPDPAHDGWPHRRRRVAHQPVPERTAADLRLALARLPGRRDRGRADPRCRRPRACPDRARVGGGRSVPGTAWLELLLVVGGGGGGSPAGRVCRGCPTPAWRHRSRRRLDKRLARLRAMGADRRSRRARPERPLASALAGAAACRSRSC